jgi:hypothetical protein
MGRDIASRSAGHGNELKAIRFKFDALTGGNRGA